jgi:surface antigen
MKSEIGRTLVWGVLFAAGLIAPERPAAAGNCVFYARAATGVSLFGPAGGWWEEAAGLYERGHVPEAGSILVFRRTGFIPSGHVAVVSKVIGPGQVLVDHSNWYHGTITRDTPVIDTSPDHDWTQVAVMNVASGEFGRDSPTYGFVYPETGSPAASQAAYDPAARSALLRVAVAADGGRSQIREPEEADSRERPSRRRERRRWTASADAHRSEHRSAVHGSQIRVSHAAARSASGAIHSARAWRAPSHAHRRQA